MCVETVKRVGKKLFWQSTIRDRYPHFQTQLAANHHRASVPRLNRRDVVPDGTHRKQALRFGIENVRTCDRQFLLLSVDPFMAIRPIRLRTASELRFDLVFLSVIEIKTVGTSVSPSRFLVRSMRGVSLCSARLSRWSVVLSLFAYTVIPVADRSWTVQASSFWLRRTSVSGSRPEIRVTSPVTISRSAGGKRWQLGPSSRRNGAKP